MHYPARHALTGAALVCVTLGFSFIASDFVSATAPALAVRLHLPFTRVAAVEGPAPGSSASPAPRVRRPFYGSGPIILKGTGNVGLAVNRYGRNGSALGQDTLSSGMNVQIERRTEQSAITINQPLGYATGGSSIGQLLMGYRTPKYSLSYGSVTAPGESLIGLGGFARGVSITIPRRNGDLSYLTSTATQTDGVAYRILGVRTNQNVRRGVLQTTALYGRAEQGGGREAFLDFVYRRGGRTVTSTSEVSLSRTSAVPNLTDGTRLAAAFHADVGFKSGFLSFDTKFVPQGIATLQSSIPPGLDTDLTYRRSFRGIGSVSLDLAHTDTRLAVDDVTHSDRIAATITRPLGTGSVQLIESLSGVHDFSSSSLSRQLGLTLSQQFRQTSLSATYQASAVGGSGGEARQSQLGFSAGRNALGGSLSYGFTRATLGSPGSVGTLLTNSLTYTRPIGKKATLSIVEGLLANTTTGTVATTSNTTTVSLSRRLSNAIAISTNGSVTHQSGIGGGTSTAFSANLTGPVNFGNTTRYTGRSNPNIPAIIRGSVSQLTVAASPYDLSATPRGYNNVLVVLDGRQTQRTDANGQFEFRFVPQGTHTVSIESSTLGPGVIPDRDSDTVRVLGGQVVDLLFTVGNFAGVTGAVTVERNGVRTGVGNLTISVDGSRSTTTNADGHYTIGQLGAGSHTVAVSELSIPSNVIIADRTKTVTVANGIATRVDFSGQTLGSIGGTVLFESGGGFGDFVGAKNVYVIAQPGEHAGITSEDGAFLLDNLPPGTYTLEVDKDTLPEGQDVVSGPTDPVVVSGGSAIGGIVFKLGTAAKDVVFTFNNGKKQPVVVDVSPAAAPPGAVLEVSAHTSAEVKSLAVESDVFGNFPLKYMKDEKVWRADVIVPPLAKGNYSLTVAAKTKNVTDGEALVSVNPALPLSSARTIPQHPKAGQTVHVIAKILGPVEAGDVIKFDDGYTVPLPKGDRRIFKFDVRLWSRGLPYGGQIVTRRNITIPFSLR